MRLVEEHGTEVFGKKQSEAVLDFQVTCCKRFGVCFAQHLRILLFFVDGWMEGDVRVDARALYLPAAKEPAFGLVRAFFFLFSPGVLV